jgi:hypothetical protein
LKCPECGKRLEVAVCMGPHPDYKYVSTVDAARFRALQEKERRESYRRPA